VNKIKTVNLKGDYVNFERVWSDKREGLIATIGADTPKGNVVQVKIKFDFDCLPYVMPSLRKAWQAEREVRESAIRDIDASLGLNEGRA